MKEGRKKGKNRGMKGRKKEEKKERNETKEIKEERRGRGGRKEMVGENNGSLAMDLRGTGQSIKCIYLCTE